MDMTIGMRSKKGPLMSMALSFNNKGPFGGFYRYIGEEDTYKVFRETMTDSDGNEVDLGGVAFELQDQEFIGAIREGRQPESSAASCVPCNGPAGPHRKGHGRELTRRRVSARRRSEGRVVMTGSRQTVDQRIAFIGFGEAAQAFAAGWRSEADVGIAAFDIKTDVPETRDGKLGRLPPLYRRRRGDRGRYRRGGRRRRLGGDGRCHPRCGAVGRRCAHARLNSISTSIRRRRSANAGPPRSSEVRARSTST